MKYPFITVAVCCVISISCSKKSDYRNPLNEERFSIDFLVPPSIGSPYQAGDPLFISLIMAANKVQVQQVDLTFSDQSTLLDTVIKLKSIAVSPLSNDKLWTMQYSTGLMYSIPPKWSGKTVVVAAVANGKSAVSSFQVK
jgi:hypothetical protein